MAWQAGTKLLIALNTGNGVPGTATQIADAAIEFVVVSGASVVEAQ